MTTIQLNDKIVRIPGNISSDIDNDVVIFSIDNGKYYGTRQVGSRIWQLIEQPTTISEVCATLETEFEVDPSVCQAEVSAFLGQLVEEKLLQVIKA